MQLDEGPEHLNSTGCVINSTPDKGRGVYASRRIPRGTVIEISPVLLFSKDEYQQHGRHTVLDHYTFVWTQGRLALALGLGSLFNHSDSPNVSYKLDTTTDSIRYTTSRDVTEGEELSIFYGQNLWFSSSERLAPSDVVPDQDDGWGGLSAVDDDDDTETNPYLEGDPEEIIPEEDLPFIRFKLPPEEEEAHTIRTVQAWVVDVQDPRLITALLRWLKQAGLEGPELGHLKRIRKQANTTSLLLSTTAEPPQIPQELNLPSPYLLSVPASSALTLPSLSLKSALWPTMYTPRRKDEPEPWTRHKLRWAWDAMKAALDAARKAQVENEELPIAAHIPIPCNLENDTNSTNTRRSAAISIVASDTRRSTQHPLRHSSINAIRQMADYRAASQDTQDTLQSTDDSSVKAEVVVQNGTGYLLTDQTFFVTHEPCIMCSMALLHSRVKEVMFLYPMPQTGGCGGCACLPTLKGVNHRFSILQWEADKSFGDVGLDVNTSIDA